MSTLRDRIQEDMKSAMRAKDKARLAVIRLVLAAIKQKEVDERIKLEQDEQVLVILEKMVKQRRDSINQYESAKREDLAAIERQEVVILQEYMPVQMSTAEIEAEIAEIIAATGAAGPADMGKVMGAAKGKMQGLADMGQVSQLVKAKLSTS
ncbi:GatB/YqeY domain-containing protein [Pseudomonadota bacterium]